MDRGSGLLLLLARWHKESHAAGDDQAAGEFSGSTEIHTHPSLRHCQRGTHPGDYSRRAKRGISGVDERPAAEDEQSRMAEIAGGKPRLRVSSGPNRRGSAMRGKMTLPVMSIRTLS